MPSLLRNAGPALTALLLLSATSASGGPWPREPGQGFAALSAGRRDISLWLEYGMRPGRWLTADLRREAGDGWFGALIWSQALPLPEGRFVAAFHARTEVWRDAAGDYGEALRVTLNGGTGISWPVSGWATLEAGYDYRYPDPWFLADWSLGLRLRPRFALLLQGEHRRYRSGQREDTLALGAILDVTEKIRLSSSWRQSRSGAQELRVAAWLEF